MPFTSPSPRRPHRAQVATVLSLTAISALAASWSIESARRTAATSGLVVAPTSQAAGTTANATAGGSGATVASGRAKLLALPTTAAGWTSVNNKGLNFKTGLVTGDAPSAQPLRLAVSLKLRDVQGLKTFIDNSHTPGNLLYGARLTTQQFNDTYAPTADQAQAVSDYLRQMGFQNVAVAGNRAVITATGTAGLAQAAFNTHIVNFTWQGKTLYGNTTDVQVPNALADLVLSVAGINNIPAMHLHNKVAPGSFQDLPPRRLASVNGKVASPSTGTAATHASGYTGPQYEVAYDANKVTPAYATTVGIVSAGTDLSQVTPQLLLAERINKQPVVPVTIDQIAGFPVPATQATDNDGEWDLDSQAASGIAENLNQIIFYNTTDLSDASLVAAVNKFAADNIAQVGNQSYGGCEATEIGPLGDVGGFEQAFMQAVAQGQTWFASTGDTGSGCGSPVNTGYPTGVPDPEYPASSPNIVAAGGTTLSSDANFNYVSESAWIGGGAGTSEIFAPPKWQVSSGAVASATVGGTAGSLPTGGSNGSGVPAAEAGIGRGTADMSMAADPASGLATFVGGARETIGGTSLSSPLSAGSYARMQTAHCNTLGFGAPRFYALDTKTGPMSTATGFHDITTGSLNGIYLTTTGWDNPTGFGSFDILAVNNALPQPTNCVLNQKPVAVLAADHTSANAPAQVIFSGSGSSDPDGDKLVQYVLDFGDNSDVVIQSGAVFAPHTYALPGTYTATLSVRDAVGNASLPATLPVTIYGTPQGCALPGQQLVTSPTGVALAEQGQDLAAGQDDLLATYFAEPGDGTNNLVVTMKVKTLASPPMAGFRWVTYFDNPEDGKNYYVAMVTADGAAPVYNYGLHTYTGTGTVTSTATPVPTLTSFQVLGTLDAKSTFATDGTITLFLDKSKIGLKTGDVLQNISSSVRTSAPDGPSGTTSGGQGLTQDTGTATQTYTLVGNDVCKADVATPPTAPTNGGGTSTPTTGGSGGGGGGGMTSPTTGGSGSGGTTSPTTGGSGSGTGITTVATGSGNREVEAGRGGTGSGAMGWLVLLPLSVGALRRRRPGVGRRTGA